MKQKDRRIIAEAQELANLLADPVYKQLIAGVLGTQLDVMRNPRATPEDLTEAHAMVRALDRIDYYARSVHNAAVVEDRKPE